MTGVIFPVLVIISPPLPWLFLSIPARSAIIPFSKPSISAFSPRVSLKIHSLSPHAKTHPPRQYPPELSPLLSCFLRHLQPRHSSVEAVNS